MVFEVLPARGRTRNAAFSLAATALPRSVA
jgi:hypothetical protein